MIFATQSTPHAVNIYLDLVAFCGFACFLVQIISMLWNITSLGRIISRLYNGFYIYMDLTDVSWWSDESEEGKRICV